MPSRSCSILSIAPYPVLPPSSGGQLCIVSMHDALGQICQDHMIGTANNKPGHDYAFQLHPVFPAGPARYLPFHSFNAILGIARRYDSTHIICEHPYMAPTAIRLARRLGISWFLRSHNIESERFRMLGKPWWRILRLYERTAMHRADGIFFITPEDREWAVAHYGVVPERCYFVPFGTTLQSPPGGEAEAKIRMAEQLGLQATVPWLYFLGANSYQPNADAVLAIATEIAPRLRQQGIDCQILIGGKGLPQAVQQAVQDTGGLVRYLGFIDALDPFLKACDVMLNPVLTGGGIKTKVVEALGYNKMVVSTAAGAAGLLPDACGSSLLVSPDGDWEAFTRHAVLAMTLKPQIPAAFCHDHYYWGNIAEHIIKSMQGA